MSPVSPELGSGPEHLFLAKKVGVWDMECEYFISQTDEPVRAKGVDIVRALGPYWVLAEAKFELPGLTIEGQATTGYDPVAKRYRSTWIDSATPFLYTFEGSYQQERDLLELEGLNLDPQSGRPARYRSRELFGTPNDRLFELLVESSPGMETPILRYQYTRRE